MKVRPFALIAAVLTLIGMVDSVRLLLTGHLDTPGFRTIDNTTAIFQIVSAVGTLFALLALLALKVTGRNPIFRFLTYVPVIGAAALIVGFVLKLAGQPNENNFIGAFGQLATMGGLLIVGILTIAAKQWVGWRKLTPLMVVLSIPLGAIVVGLTGQDGWFGIINSLMFLLFCYALYTSQPAEELPHELAAAR